MVGFFHKRCREQHRNTRNHNINQLSCEIGSNLGNVNSNFFKCKHINIVFI